MKIKVNSYTWDVQFIDGESKKLKPDEDIRYLGLTEYTTQMIYIRKGMSKEMTRTTVIHELVHVFIFSFGHHTGSEESICDFFGSHADSIMRLTDKICGKDKQC